MRGISIHVETLRCAYELLRATTPIFKSLPPAEVIKFQVIRKASLRGDYEFDGNHRIRVSTTNHTTLEWLLITVAHEMCHMKQQLEHPSDRAAHGSRWRHYADIVCRVHSFDRGAF